METAEIQEPPVEQSEDEASASLDDGFKTEVVEEPSPQAQPPKEPEPDPAPAPDPEPEPPKIVPITETQLQSLLDGLTELNKLKAESVEKFTHLTGQIGGVQGFLKQLTEGTAAGQTVTVTAADLEELQKDFPELADITAKGLARVLNKLKLHGTGPAPEQLQELIDTRATQKAVELLDTREKSRLTRKYPNWKDIVGVPPTETAPPPETPFRQWLATKPAEYKAQIEGSRDAEELSDAISTFQKETKPKETPKPGSSREAVLRSAVPLRSHHGGPPTPTGLSPEQEMEQGYKRELAS